MPAQLLDGKAIAANIRAKVASDAARLADAAKPVHLVAILVGEEPAALVYADNQARTCRDLGIAYTLCRLPGDIAQAALLGKIESLNADPAVTGIMVHLPLPEALDTQQAQHAINVLKDVEGVSPANIGHVLYGHTIIAPSTALAVIELIQNTGVNLRGAETVVVGASGIVGKPAALLLTQNGATVTLCHIDTRDLIQHTRRAEVLVVAVGRAGLIGREHLRPGAVVIDVGINRVLVPDGAGGTVKKTVGDVDAAAAREVASWLSPVPGGVGPVTVAMLLKNTLRSALLVHGLEPP